MAAWATTPSITTSVELLITLIPLSPLATIVKSLIVTPLASLTLIALGALEVNLYPLPSNVIGLLITIISLEEILFINSITSPASAFAIACHCERRQRHGGAFGLRPFD